MRISGQGGKTYLLLNGIAVPRPLRLGSSVELLPANCSPDPNVIMRIAESEVALGVMAIFLRQVKSQLLVTEDDPKTHATLAWNSLWDAVLLSALFDCEAVCNFQSALPAEEFGEESKLEVTNYHFRGLTGPPRVLSEDECKWIETNFEKSRILIDISEFQNAVHCMATYRWHSHPRARLALLWSGIEGLFNVQNELVFRLSLYIARLLEPEDVNKRKKLFAKVKDLYKHRSKAVHGSKIKGSMKDTVEESANLLNRLIYSCIESGGIPNADELVP